MNMESNIIYINNIIYLLSLMNMELKPIRKTCSTNYVHTTKKQHCISVAELKVWNNIINIIIATVR